MRFQVLVILALTTTGCMSGYKPMGPPFEDIKDELQAVSPGLSRVTIFRTDEYSLYFGRAAPIKHDDNEIAQVPKGGFVFFDIEPGSQKIYAETWDYPGRCGYKIDAESDKKFFFEVMPRKESIAKGLLISSGGMIGISVAKSLETLDEECRGMFALVPIQEKEAILKIQLLRRDK